MITNQKLYSLTATKLIRLQTLTTLPYFRDAFPHLDIDIPPAIETKEIVAKELTQNRVANWGDKVAFFIGFLSQLATVASYVYLYEFAGANILAL